MHCLRGDHYLGDWRVDDNSHLDQDGYYLDSPSVTQVNAEVTALNGFGKEPSKTLIN